MSAFVVDASVAIKWMVPEPHQAEALRLRASGTPLHAPALLLIELTSALLKKVRQGSMSRSDADALLVQLARLPIQFHPESPLLASAFDAAIQTGTTVYDCLYLALALRLGGQMVTADDAFVAKLASTAWAPSVLRLQDFP